MRGMREPAALDGSTELAWVEHALPGPDGAARVRLAQELGVALEVACRPELELDALGAARVVCVQAWGMHDAHPLHPAASRRAEAARHLDATLELARQLGAPRVIAVCGYGRSCERDPKRALARCRAFFGEHAVRARELGVRILIEPLSPLRSDALTDPHDVARLIRELGAPDVFAGVLDTGHLLDGGRDPRAVLTAFDAPLDELQLRGADSRAPTGDEPFRAWLAARPEPPAVVSVEYREVLDPARVRALARRLRRAWDASAAAGPAGAPQGE